MSSSTGRSGESTLAHRTYDPLVMRVATVLCAAVTATLVASGAGAFGSSGPEQTVTFADLPHGWGEAIPRDVRPNSRIVGTLDGHSIATGPTRNGNFCEAFWVKPKGGGWGGCVVRGPAPDHLAGDFHAYLINGGWESTDTTVLSVAGATAAGPSARLCVLYADGTRERLRMIWVGKPIRAGFFFRTVPSDHRTKGHRPTALELRRGDKVIARQRVILKRVR